MVVSDRMRTSRKAAALICIFSAVLAKGLSVVLEEGVWDYVCKWKD